MEQKDPKDMTASELLRATADSIREGVSSRGVRFSSADSIDEFRDMLAVDSEPTYAEDMTSTLSVLADKIDAELSDARAEGINASLRAGAEIWAKANGWPDFKDGEDFGTWLDRCAIPRPRFESGEPVQFGEETDVGTVAGFVFNAPSRPRCCAYEVVTEENGAVSIPDGDVLKRPAPEALGADGKPIVVGDKVWLDEEHSRCAGSSGSEGGYEYSLCGIERQEMLTVEDAHHEVCGRDYIRVGMCNAWCHSSWLTHTPPDTQERIDEDARKNSIRYWGCEDFSCDECPALIDGKKPVAFYELDLVRDSCSEAQKLDLLRRQRELDARKGGAE